MVMRAMRENTKWVMLIVAVAFVGLMVFEWGMDLTGQSSAQLTGGEVGEVNGETITYQEYITTYQRLYQQEQQARTETITAAENKQIEDAAFDQIVMQRLIEQELRRRGIVVTNQEVADAARFAPPPEFMSDPAFQTDGQFDLTKYQSYLANQVTDEGLRSLEAYYRELIPRSKLYFQVVAGVYPTDAELWRIWRDLNETATVDFIALDPNEMVPESEVSITDAEIQRYYRENREDFERPARANVRYVAIDRAPLPADTAAALQRAESLRARIAGGEDFAEIAQAESADSASAVEGGRLVVTRGQTVPAFDAAAFARPVGQIGEPILTQFGYHVLRVESRDSDSATVRHILIPIEHSPESEDLLFDRADSLEVLVETMPLEQAAAALGLDVRTSELVPDLPFVPGVGDASEGVEWAFEEAQVGDASPVFEGRGAYYAFELVSREDARTLSIEEATETIRSAILSDKRLERATEMARELVQRIRNGESLENVAGAVGASVRSAGPFTRNEFVAGLGRFSPAVGAAFGLDVGEISDAIVSNRTLYILRKTAGTEASREEWEAQKEDQRRQVAQGLSESRWGLFLAALRENAEIRDLRAEFERQAEAAAARQPAGIY